MQQMQAFVVEHLQKDRALPTLEAARLGAAAYLTGNDRLSPVEQLEIYRVQFWLRHTSSLLDDNPGVSGILGQAEWERLVESYFAKASPTSWTLRDLGQGFADHIASRPETPHQQLCVDMARLEWAYTEVFDAENAPALEASALAAIPPAAWETARMRFNPALRLLSLTYPVAALRRQLRDAQDEPDAAPVPIPERSPVKLVVYRSSSLNLKYSKLGDAAFRLLELLAQGTPLVPACEQTANEHPAEADQLQEQVGTWFQDWGARGWIVGVEQTG